MSFYFLRIGDRQLTHRSAHRGDWHSDGPAWRRTRDMLQTEISVRERGKYLRQRAVLHVPTELLPCLVKRGEHAFALVTFPFEVNSQVWFADCLLYLTPCIHITEFIWNWTFQTWCHLLEKTLTFCLWHEHYPFCWWLFIGFATEDCLEIKNSRRFCWYFIDMYIT